MELIIAMTIFLTLSSVMLADYNGMNSRITLDTNAHQMAQWVRQTQISAMSVKHTQSDASTFPGYGLHFDRATPGQFIFFADLVPGVGLSPNKRYDPLIGMEKCGDAGVECEQIVKLPKGNSIEKLCSEMTPFVLGPDCDTFSNANDFDIIFTRPDPDAFIGGEYSTGNYATSSRAVIYLKSVKGYRRLVEVWVTGQVSVQ